MQMYLDCYPCLLRQSLQSARLAGVSVELQKEILIRTLQHLLKSDINQPAAITADGINKIIKKFIGDNDPYKEIKQKSNDEALKNYKDLINILNNSEDKLKTALTISGAFNREELIENIEEGKNNAIKFLSQVNRSVKSEQRNKQEEAFLKLNLQESVDCND